MPGSISAGPSRTSVFPVGGPVQTPWIESALADAINAMTVAEGLFFAPCAAARGQAGAAGTPKMLAEHWQRNANVTDSAARTTLAAWAMALRFHLRG